MTRLIFSAGLACALLSSTVWAGPRTVDPALATPAGMQPFPWSDTGVYPVIAMPGRITDIVLEPGEALVETGAIAAGDTARWTIGDTTSGTGAQRRVHVLVKPTEPDLSTNLLINTDRRTYYLELRASSRTWQAQVSWVYPVSPPVLVEAPPVAAELDLSRVNRGYRIEGDHPLWRPLAVFDDGHRAYVEFGPGVVLDDLPPLYRLGVDGKTSEIINYHIEGRRIVVERLFDRAELRFGIKRQAQRVRLIRQAASVEAVR
ncbi:MULTISPECIES: P-type conjugative transfer protein TrbG [Caulobacter]|jgi:P-type conjugative transfer protein TrbG|uniref:P-type conjugative transfer protein TrbG n=1 Tax=Caulobacter vibrioides OR37 TaxID=1292034 RepID=R0E7Y3_CAUVI|nr:MULTISPECIES: P-type conjugative transfer protein TrbG [Caulobacter]ENZ81603.1 P-type conjugative transfer protein TrbG [Caulobacter vibrioides OR37]PIB96956.1 P-type conjugative transfer protein TrbG [Caulobacter sp. X]